MSTPYQHIPIVGARSIRVLELQPATDPAAPIYCRLSPVCMDNLDVNYTALSYTWDNQDPSCEVDCDGGCLLITPNCNAAIRQLRSATEIEVLWIDSICIDQNNTPEAIEERNVQVAMMGEIYKSAARVVAWLGPGNEQVERALRQIMDIAMVVRSAQPSLENRRMVQQRLHDYTRTLSESIHTASDDPITPLFECSWFYRMWTIQEVTLSAIQKTFLRCGSLEIPWPALYLVVDALKVARYRWSRWEEATALQKQLTTYLITRRIPGSRAILDDNPRNVHNDPLVFDILANTRKKLAGNEKDKVFALYGLFTELEIPFPKPDYKLPVEDIYRQATAASIRYDKVLYVLYHAPSDKRRESLASWVPDWAERGFEPSDGRYGILRDRFAASGPGQPIFQFSSDERALVLRGKIIDMVIYKAEPLPDVVSVASTAIAGDRTQDSHITYIRNNHDTARILRSWVETSTRTEYPTGESAKDSLQRTLVLDNPDFNRDLTGDGSFDAWYNNMHLNDIELTSMATDQLGLGQPSGNEQPSSDELQSLTLFGQNRFHRFITLSNSLKCFFYTENNYFGTAPDPLPISMQVGDVIALVSGLEMPVVLRPIECGYRLLTHVYLHGVMYGELWPEVEDELADIVLL